MAQKQRRISSFATQPLKAKIHYTSFPVRSKSVTSWHATPSMEKLRETCAMDFGQKVYTIHVNVRLSETNVAASPIIAVDDRI